MHNIQPKQRWQNSRGELVTVVAAAFNRVAFVRDGFDMPCTWSEQRFTKEFTLVQEVNHA
ncbi:DUF4222 domain-containing protein [Pantoea ananatis]|uniref:DUF4222 domain-containing protein n=1 Tax=Pantoea ananas TaxID=553 RepID=UPI000D5EBA93|nr:DUF4222 domain-containing protein [Pantoea ananatis]PVY82794.1 uncharacterized protein DUF4222 [Pantoea ananatis]